MILYLFGLYVAMFSVWWH